jgi:hypothetical protein
VTQFSLTPLKPRYARANSDLISFNIETVILRVVADISSLPDNTYGLPLYSNFPLVDAVIQPDTLIQYTISPTNHKGAVEQLATIREQLRDKNSRNHRMIFVVPKTNLKTFKHQENLASIRQFIITDTPQVGENSKAKAKGSYGAERPKKARA